VREIFICRVECTMAVPGQLQTGNYFFCFPSSVEIFAATGRCLYPFLFLFYEQDAGLCGAVLGFLGHSICWRGGGRLNVTALKSVSTRYGLAETKFANHLSYQ
jgi:hypothetical protein